MSTSIASNSI